MKRKAKMKFKKTWGGKKGQSFIEVFSKSTTKIKQGRARGSTERDTYYVNEFSSKKEA